MRRLSISREALLVGGFLLMIFLFGWLIFTRFQEEGEVNTLLDDFQQAGVFVREETKALPVVAWIEENDKYVLSDSLDEGVSVKNQEDLETKKAEEASFQLTFQKNYAEPLSIDLGNGKVISVTDKSGTSDFTSRLLTREKEVTGEQETAFLRRLVGSDEQPKVVKEQNRFVQFVSPDERKTLLYSYGRDKGLGIRSLKHWTLYEKGDGHEKEVYQFDKALLTLNQDGGVGVYYFDGQAIKNQPEVSGVEPSLTERVTKTFVEETKQAIARGDIAPDFTVPKPYLVDKDGKQMDIEWKLEDEKTLSWEINVERSQYPLAVDPTMSFVARSTMSGGAVITGETGAGNFGTMIIAGDFNADGRTDLVVGAESYSSSTGRVYVFYNDGNLTTTAGFADVIITGEATSDSFGSALTSGDFNADGKSDFAVGSQGYTTNTGRTYIFYNDGSIPTTAATADVIITGETTSNKFGRWLAAADLNADGTADLISSASFYNTNTGRVYVFYGDGTNNFGTATCSGTPAACSAANADVIITGNATNDFFGRAFTVGDFNADTKVDLAVGAYNYSTAAGRVYIFYNDGSIPTTAGTADVTITGDASTSFGVALAAGDVNTDNRIDLIVGATTYTTSTGRTYIFYNDGSIPTTAATADVTITGEATSNLFGVAVATGDVNADGRVDIIVGASGYSTSTGRVYVFFNDSSIPTTALTADVIVTGESTSDQLGYSLAVGDFNTDGRMDFTAGSYAFSAADGNGRIYIFYSQNGQISTARLLTGENTNQYFGCSFAKGDFNSDGRQDLAVGAEGYSSDAGLVYLFYNDGTLPTGAASADMTISGTALSDFFGVAMAAGDFNADGRMDLAVGARGHSTNTGRAYVFYNDGTMPTAAASADAIITGGASGDYFGISLAAGDMNTDNKDDLIVGAERYSTSTGRVYVFYNGSITTESTTGADITFTGVATNNRFGGALAVGDYDNSGTDDLFVGAYARTTNTGRVYLFLNTGTIDTTSDDTITGAGTNDFLGSAMVTGDFDGDGDTDIAFSSYGFNAGGNEGRVYIFYNNETGVFPTLANANVIIDGDTDSRLGAALASGDVNADGRVDLLVGAWGYSTSTGRAYIFYNDGTYPTTASNADLVFTGDATSDIFGNTLIAYDTNGDGKEDLMVGAEGHSTNTGRIYFFETRVNFTWKLQNQIGRNIRINNNLSGEEQIMTGEWGASNTFGSSIAVGDMNADGRKDVAIGAPAYSSSTGRVYIFYSNTRLTPNASGAEVVLTGAATSDLFGTTLAMGDYNTDGKNDLAVSAPGHSSSTGRAYIFYGDGKILPASASNADVTITGNATGDLFGTSLAAGDVNNSGDTDLVVGARGYSTNTGRAYVFYNDGSIPTTAATADVTITGNASGDNFGAALTSRDFSTDGKADIAVGGYGYSTSTGRVYVFNGDGTIPTTAATADVTITGNATSDNFGATLAGGDVNKDGKADIVVGAYGYTSSTGRAYIFYGDGSIPTTAATADVTITGDATGDNFGRALAIGDINTDSFPDLVVGARSYSTSTGRAYVFYSDGSIPTTAATADATLTGEATSSEYGTAIAAGDFDDDGKTDLFIGASGYTVNTFTVGRVYLYTFNDNVIAGGATGDCFGSWLSTGDFNNDGKGDLVASSRCYSSNAGRVYIFYADGLVNTGTSGADITITGSGTDDSFGTRHATGDFNYDGKTDLLISASGYSSGDNTGRAYIYYNDGSIPTTANTADVIIGGGASGDNFGAALTTGDFNSDNRVDFAVGAYGYNPGSAASTGRTYIFYNDGSIPTTAATADVTITGNAASDSFGQTLISGDFNADSRVDLGIAAPGYSSSTGRVYLFHNDGSIPTTAATADVTLTGDSGTNFGVALASGDISRDGKTDIVVGATTYSTSLGAIYGFYNDGSIPTTAATADTTITGVSGNYLGYSLAVGDVNADGRVDIIASNDYSSASYGRVYVFYSDGTYPADTSTADKTVSSSTENPGRSLLVMDINVDGKVDIIAGDPDYSSAKGSVFSYVSETSYTSDLPNSAKFKGDVIMRGDAIVR